MEKLRVGIIGVGWPGQRHIEAYQKRPDVEISALADVNTEAARKVQSDYSVEGARIFGDYEQMLEGDFVDAVSICTPNFLHAPMAIRALGCGKHVLLEKPLANTLAEGLRIAQEVAESDRVFMMAFNNRYRRDARILKEQIERGELGEIYHAKTGWLRAANDFFLRGWFTQKEKSGGGPLIDLGVHVLDLALWFMGNPRPVSVSGVAYHKFTDVMRQKEPAADVEDMASAFVRLDNGGTVVLETSWISHLERPYELYTQLFGTRGGATINRSVGQEALSIYTVEDGEIRVSRPQLVPSDVTERGFLLYDSFASEISDFVDSIRAGVQPGATITHGLDVLRILDAIYRSAESGHEVVLTEGTDVGGTTPPGGRVRA